LPILDGRLRPLLGDQDLVLHPGEAAEANVPISAPAPARPGTKAQGQSAATKARRQVHSRRMTPNGPGEPHYAGD
jgi:hypothetical protein